MLPWLLQCVLHLDKLEYAAYFLWVTFAVKTVQVGVSKANSRTAWVHVQWEIPVLCCTVLCKDTALLWFRRAIISSFKLIFIWKYEGDGFSHLYSDSQIFNHDGKHSIASPIKSGLSSGQVAQLVERCPVHHNVVGSTPGQGTRLGCVFHSCLGSI